MKTSLLFLAATSICLSLGAVDNPNEASWTYRAADFVRSGVSLSPDGNLLFGDMKGTVYCVDPLSQELAWSVPMRGAILGTPSVGPSGIVFAGSESGEMKALDPLDGSERWTAILDGKIQTPVLSTLDGRVFVGTSRGTLYSFDGETGRPRWQTSIRSGSYGAITGAPILDSTGTLYLILSRADRSTLVAMNPESRTIRWTFEGSGDAWAGPVLDDRGNVLFGTDGRMVYSVDSGGELNWAYSADGAVKSPPVVDAGGNIFFGTLKNTVHSIDSDGSLRWKLDAKGDVLAGMAIDAAGNVLFADQGRLHRVDPEGQDKVIYDTKSTHLIRGNLLLTREGSVHFGSDDRMLHSVEVEDPLDARSPWPLARGDLRGSGQAFPFKEDAGIIGYGTTLPYRGVVTISRYGEPLEVECTSHFDSWKPFEETYSANEVAFVEDLESGEIGRRCFRLKAPSESNPARGTNTRPR